MAALFAASQLAIGQAPATGKEGMVSTAEPTATEVGLQILKGGGNAFDAAVAIGFALAVTFPEAGNLGGGGFFVGLTSHGTPMALDFRETAPRAATKNMFLDEAGNIRPGESLGSYRAVGVPGTVDGLLELQQKFGKLTLQQDIEPALKLAKFGFPVTAYLHNSLAADQDRLGNIGPTAVIFYPDGKPLAEGAVLIQPDLAVTLKRISDLGRQGFYAGDTARTISTIMEREGGLITQQDLLQYHSKWRPPFIIHSGEFELITMPLPSSGGVTIDQVLGLSDLKALKAAGHNSPEYVQRLTEAERLAYADRNQYLGDSDFVKAPVDQLTSKAYLDQRRKLMPEGRAGSSQSVGPGQIEKPETTHYCVVDKLGNVAAITYTLNGAFGMGSVLPGGGFFLNNEMDDFTSKVGAPNMFGLVQGDANSIAPGKRMLSSMTPSIIRKGERFFATIGSPGGATIITTVLQVYLNLTLFQMGLPDAVDAGRFHHQYLPDLIEFERGAIGAPDALTAMGYRLKEVGGIGDVHAIMRMPDGSLQGYSDRRGSGLAQGY